MSENLDVKIAEEIKSLVNKKVIDSLKNKKVPEFEIPLRADENIIVDKGILTLGDKTSKRRINNVKEVRPFMQLTAVLEAVHSHLSAGRHPSIRDIYYYVKHTIPGTQTLTFSEQEESNVMVEEAELLTGFCREEMGIVAETKGQIAGNIEMEAVVRGKIKSVKISELPIPGIIPSLMDRIRIKNVDADWILIVEKGAVFTSLYEDGYWEKNQCLLVTAGGQPDRATRRFISRMEKEFELPIYVLTDSDPYGIRIYLVYKGGSRGLAYESKRLAAPSVKFLGVTPSDIYKYKLPDVTVIQATKSDLAYAEKLKSHPLLQTKEWQDELQLFLNKKEKVEIEAFSKHGFDFLSEKYLPDKIKGGKFL